MLYSGQSVILHRPSGRGLLILHRPSGRGLHYNQGKFRWQSRREAMAQRVTKGEPPPARVDQTLQGSRTRELLRTAAKVLQFWESAPRLGGPCKFIIVGVHRHDLHH